MPDQLDTLREAFGVAHSATCRLCARDVKEKIAALGFEPSRMTSAEFDATIKAEIAKWRGVIEKGGIPKI
ncbi:MAG: hypothetical protein WCE79_13250 [Xanthobacteraceae bacterium]